VKTDNSITTGLVMAVVRQKSDNEIIAMGSTHLDIVGSTISGQVLDYHFAIQLPANMNSADVETEVTAMGSQ
jgi:hypothetical protein